MKMSKIILLVCIVVYSSFSLTASAGEKGGSGINGEETIILEDFQRTQVCPDVPVKKLCAKIDQNINDPMWEIKILTPNEQNEEDFFLACCFNANSSR